MSILKKTHSPSGSMPGPLSRALVFSLALVCLAGVPGALLAQGSTVEDRPDQGADLAVRDDSGGRLFTVRRALGVVFIAGGVGLAMQGFDYRDQADRFYDAYETASDPDEIEKFYQRTTNRDVKSQVSWALAAASGVTGLRLILTGNDAHRLEPGFALGSAANSRVTLAPELAPRVVGLRLQHHFY